MAPSDRSVFTVLLLLLASLGMVASGCGGIDDPFKRITPDDDDDTVQDDDDDDDDSTDDDDTPDAQPPTLTIIAVSSTDPEISDFFTVNFELDDPDSQEFFVDVTYDTDTAPDNPATLSDSPNPWEGDSGSIPTSAFAGVVIWDTNLDIPTVAEGVRIRLCPTDAEGNAGPCEVYPEETEEPISVFNAPPPTSGELCQPGDLEELEFTSGEALIALSDGECLNYEAPQFPDGTPTDFSAQFMLLLVNTGSDDATYEITWDIDPESLDLGGDDDDAVNDDDDSVGGDDDDSAHPSMEGPRSSNFAGQQRYANRPWAGPRFDVPRRERPQSARADRPAPIGSDLPGIDLQLATCTEALDENDLHADQQTFKIRTKLEEDPQRETLGANLRALGDTVAVYVDEATPLDIDYDCDGTIDDPHLLPAEGFDNCDLQEIVDVIEANIAPTLASLYGELPDVNQDCRVTLLISHKLNELTRELDSDLPYLVRSLVEPEIDLWAEDITLNENSNQQEILFAYAPDPLGLWNPENKVSLDNYLGFELAGQVAYSWAKLIGYGVHRQVGKTLLFADNPDHVAKPPNEEDWMDDGLAWLAADLTGFGANIHRDAWIYLDRPHLEGLRENNELTDFEDRGAQYLFARYLVDLFGDVIIWDIVHASTTDATTNEEVPTQGVDSILSATGEEDFSEFTLEWVAAMAVTGRLNVANTQLVLDTDVRQYDSPTLVSLPDPTTPVTGELYGANGYQQGIQLRGFNHTYVDGTSAAGSAEVLFAPAPLGSPGQPLHKMENLDLQVFHPQRAFYGSVAGLHGAAAILVSGLEQPENFLLIESSSEDLLGMVIRVNDYHPIPDIGDPSIPLTVEDVDGPYFTQAIDLGVLNPDGSERRVIGVIDPEDAITLTPAEPLPETGDDDDAAPPADDDDDGGEDASEGTISDTDRYTFTLDAPQRVGVWVDRRLSSLNGADLDDPFIAVAFTSDVPNTAQYDQWGVGFDPALHGPCSSPDIYLWPNQIPDFINTQGNLISNPVFEGEFEPITDSEEYAPGELDCEFDIDQDGVPDAEEAGPADIVSQIQQRQAQNLKLDNSFYSGTFDVAPWNGDVEFPWYGPTFVDVDSNEDPDDDLASAYFAYNIGGRMLADGEEAVWQALLPAGQYTIIVGDGSGGFGAYDMSVRILPN